MPSPDLFLVGRLPSAIDQMRPFLTEELLGLPTSRPAQLVELVERLDFERAMIALGQLLAHTAHMRGDSAAQVELAGMVFGDVDLIEMVGLVAARLPGGVEVFAEQHLTCLQRLAVLHAQDGALDDLAVDGQEVFDRALVAASCLADEVLGPAPGPSDRAAWLAYLIANAAYNRADGAMESMTRPLIMFHDIAAEHDLQGHPDACPIHEWLVEDYGFGVEEQFALGFAVLAGTKALDETTPFSERSLLSGGYLDDLARRLGRDPAAVRGLLVASRSWYRDRFQAKDHRERATWDRIPFEQRPLVQLTDGRCLLVSPRAIQSWLSDGLYHRALAAARRRGQAMRFLRFNGALTERYALRLMRTIHPEPRPSGSGRVAGEQRYGNRAAAKLSPDISLEYGTELVLMEVASGRFTLQTLQEVSAEAALRDLQRVVSHKLDQLGARVANLLAGDWHPAGIRLDQLDRIWPVLVTAEVLQNDLLWDAIDARLPSVFADPRVGPVTLLELADLEQLGGLVERGFSVLDLLKRKATGPYSRLDFRRFVFHTANLPADVRISAVEERWEDAILRVAERFGFDLGRTALRDQTSDPA